MKINEIFENNDRDVVEDVHAAYMEAAVWADLDEEYSDTKSIDDISNDMRGQALDDVRLFLNKAKEFLNIAQNETTLNVLEFWSQVGHDLWLTRNGHGAGFWDDPKYYGGQENADALSKVARQMGELNVYVGDDGMIYTQ